MHDQPDFVARCAATVAALDMELEWHLNAEQQRAYCAIIQRLVAEDELPARLRRIALNYHHDHALVQALADQAHARHNAAWNVWMTQVIVVLRHAGLHWSDDTAVDLDDLAQVARAELARALPQFRYASRFSTWSYQVIVQSVRRYLRDTRAQKRAGRPAPLEGALAIALGEHAHPETIANGHVFAALVDQVLAKQPDARLAAIFRLWAEHDTRVEDIGRRVHLGPSQIRLLIARIQELLRNDPAIRDWYQVEQGDDQAKR